MSAPDVRRSMFKVLRGAQVVGAGFLVTRRLVATCRHVVDACAPGDIRLEAVATQRTVVARPHAAYRTEVDDEDLAILEVDTGGLDGVEVAVLGSSRSSRDHRFTAYGFPASDPAGAWEPGIIGRVDKEGQPFERLRLHETDVREGFSGGPLLDEQTRRVVGVISARPENHAPDRPLRAAEATPSERLRLLVPELTLSADCPYRDLESFRESDAAFWKGRAAVLGELTAVIDTRPSHVTVAGPSGVGKSSLLAAGLVATLRSEPRRAGWDVRLMRPGLDPRTALHHAVGDPGAPGKIIDCLERWRDRAPGKRLVLAIDQFEDLLLRAAPDDQAALLGFVRELESPRLADLPLTIVAALREGFDERLGEVAPALKDRLFRRMVAMPTTLTDSEVLAIIREPAEAIGLRFEPESVSETLLRITRAEFPANADDASAGTLATALPVLEVALTQLWQTATTDGAITLEALNALGENTGILGILTRWADQVHTRLATASDRAVADDILVELVQFGDAGDGSRDKGRRVRLSTLRQRLARHAQLERVLHELIACRLVVVARGDEATIELIHDALMLRWAHYSDLRQANRAFLIWHEWLQREAELWSKPDAPGDENRGRLLRDRDLATAQQMQLDHAARIGEHATRFIARSAQAERAARQRIRRWQQAAAAAAIAVAVALGYLLHRARVAEAEANAQRAEAHDQAVRARQVAQAQTAAAIVQLSRRDGHTVEALGKAIHLAAPRVADELAAAARENSSIAVITGWLPTEESRAPDELLAALIDAQSAVASSVTLSVGAEYLWAAAVSPDDRFVVTRSTDRPSMTLRTRLWDARNGAQLQIVDTRDLRLLADKVPQCRGDHRMSDECHKAVAFRQLISPDLTRAVAFRRADATLWVGGSDGTIAQWDARGRSKRIGRAGGDPVNVLAFDRAGARLLSVTAAGAAQVWDATTGEPIGPPFPLAGADAAGELSADGTLAVVAGAKRAFVMRVGAASPEIELSLDGMLRPAAGPPRRASDPMLRVFGVALSDPAEHVAVIGCDYKDRTGARVWKLSQRRVIQQFESDRDCDVVQFSAGGCELIDYDGLYNSAVTYPLCGDHGAVKTELHQSDLRKIEQLRVDDSGVRRGIVSADIYRLQDARELFRYLHFDKRELYSPSADGRVLLIDRSTSVLERRLAFDKRPPPFGPAFLRWSSDASASPDGRWIPYRAGRNIRVIMTRAGATASELEACDEQGRDGWRVDFSPDGGMLTVRCGMRLTLWRYRAGWQRVGDLAPIDDLLGSRPPWVDWLPGGEHLMIGGMNGASLWSTADGQRKPGFEPRRYITARAVTARGNLAVLASVPGPAPDLRDQAQVEVVRLSDGRTLCSMPILKPGEVSSLEVSDTGDLVLGVQQAGPAYLWRIADCSLVLDRPLDQASTVHLAPDGSGVAVASSDPAESRFWPSANGRPAIALPVDLAYHMLAIDRRAPRRWAMVRARGNQVLLFDPVDQKLTTLPELPVAGEPEALRYAPDGALVFQRTSDTTVFDPVTQTRRYTLDVALERDSMRWSSDGKLIAGQDAEGLIRVWRWADGTPLFTLRPGCDSAALRFLPGDDGLIADCYRTGVVYSFRRDDLLRQSCDLMRGRPEYAEVQAACDPQPRLPVVELP